MLHIEQIVAYGINITPYSLAEKLIARNVVVPVHVS